MTKNDIITLRIDGYASSGDGVAHHEGRAVFVRRSLEGELISARILKVTNAAVFAKVEELLEASTERTEPECVNFGKCGGCALMHMSYAEELHYKHSRVSDALRRIGGVDIELPPVEPSHDILRYRNKAIFEVGFENGAPVTGFYRERSHDIVTVSDCLLQSQAANCVAETVKGWMEQYAVADGLIRYLFCRTAADGGVQIVIVASRRKLYETQSLIDELRERVLELRGVLICVNNSSGNVVLTDDIRVIYGDECLTDVLCGHEFSLSPQSFYQVNHTQAEQLYACAVTFAALGKDDRAVELYCGAGTITLALARTAGFVYGIELVPEAVLNAEKNAAKNGVTNVEFILGDAGETALTLAKSGIMPTVVVVDPPRKGLSPDGIEAIVKMSPQRVVYVSCDPATLARDVKLLGADGYSVAKVRAFDMFPRCAHVETVVVLTKDKNQEAKNIYFKTDENSKPIWKDTYE